MTEDLVEKFWDTQHTANNTDALSGCDYKETIAFLHLNSYIQKDTKVLEIGVGLGYVTQGLYEAGAKVSALDISDVALARVTPYCEHTYSIKDIKSISSDYYDVIICNNVVQHVPTKLLIEELEEIVRVLNTHGVLAIEFVSNKSFEDNGEQPSLDDIKNGGLCRSPGFLEKIFNDMHCMCAAPFSREVDIGIVQGHHVFHVVKV